MIKVKSLGITLYKNHAIIDLYLDKTTSENDIDIFLGQHLKYKDTKIKNNKKLQFIVHETNKNLRILKHALTTRNFTELFLLTGSNYPSFKTFADFLIKGVEFDSP